MRLETWRGQDPNTAPNAYPTLPTPPAQQRTPQHPALTHPELDHNPKVTQVTHYSMPGTTRHWLLAARGVAEKESD